MQKKLILLSLAAGLVLVPVWLWRLCNQRADISFLAHHAPAEWIIYPKPPAAQIQGRTAVAEAPELMTTFRRGFELGGVPPSARLVVRACRRVVVAINGQYVELPAPVPNWKAAIELEVARYLKPGTNDIRVSTFNPLGPPALWLDIEHLGIASDASWEASCEGAVWQQAALASAPQTVARSSLFYGEETIAALSKCWRQILLFTIVAGLLVGASMFWFGHKHELENSKRWGWICDPAREFLALLICLWLFLFLHNLSLLPRGVGYDRDGHWEYISFIQQHGALPFPEQGWEMHQPPLFYWLAATLLNLTHHSAATFDALVAIRVLSLAIGLIHLVALFISLRLLFPGQPARQIVGLAVGGFMPMQLCLAHYVTNETLAACLMSVTIMFVLALFRAKENEDASEGPSGSPARNARVLCGLIGLSLGLALLTKVTAFILLPLVVLALILWGLGKQRSPLQLFLAPGIALGVAALTCGWHYARVWRHSGKLFPGDPSFHGWLDPGVLTGKFFTRFGHSLFAPFFSGFSSFGDGLYSTMWGDGMWGGSPVALYRPPWNYELMAVGFLLALLPTALIFAGFVRALVKAVRETDVRWFFLVALGGALLLGILRQTLLSPTFAVVKSFYALGGLVVLSALAGSAWGFLQGRARMVVWTVSSALALWCIVAYASFWVLPGSADTQAMLGRGLLKQKKYEGALSHLNAALNANPRHAGASAFLFATYLEQGRLVEAVDCAAHFNAVNPDEPRCVQSYATALELQGRLPESLVQTKRAIALSPDDALAREQLAARLFHLGRLEEAISECRQALRICPAEPEIHFLLGKALLEYAGQPEPSMKVSGEEPLPYALAGEFSGKDVLAGEGVRHLRFGLKLAPESIEPLARLAWVLATHDNAALRNRDEALALARHACNLTQSSDPDALTSLAAALAEAGEFAGALDAAEKAAVLLKDSTNTGLRTRQALVLESCRLKQPCREIKPALASDAKLR
jgi:tetratricopeptide (TPR) repeat protein